MILRTLDTSQPHTITINITITVHHEPVAFPQKADEKNELNARSNDDVDWKHSAIKAFLIPCLPLCSRAFAYGSFCRFLGRPGAEWDSSK
ncbi:hypothetical protein L596_023551 [Steinernema carpocapsae]|uniref:Uncharacterized protein n=1 Tax=Steinernema carpocapsae TaxID=34508 RepID=A0A4U5ME17_STECR|nr:hypothetical protein L596_023551 [Steinernema carpocapsae]